MDELNKLKALIDAAPDGATHYSVNGTKTTYWLLSKTGDKSGSSFLFYSTFEKMWLRDSVTDEDLHSLADSIKHIDLLVRIESLDKAVCEEIENRDHWEARATELATDVGTLLNIDVGEHSSANCPVQNAIDAVYQATQKKIKTEALKEHLSGVLAGGSLN